MDIEGFEFDVLGAILETAAELLPEQLGLEIHYKTRFRELPWFGRYKSAGEIALFMDSLYRRGGYHLTDRHDNPFCKHCTEVVLMRMPDSLSPHGRRLQTTASVSNASELFATTRD